MSSPTKKKDTIDLPAVIRLCPLWENDYAAEKKRTTIYIELQIHRGLKIKSASSNVTISEIIDDILRREPAQDEEDLRLFDERISKPKVPYEQVLRELKQNGKNKIEFTRSAPREIKKIPAKKIEKIWKRIDSLADDPRPRDCVKLSDRDVYRIR